MELAARIGELGPIRHGTRAPIREPGAASRAPFQQRSRKANRKIVNCMPADEARHYGEWIALDIDHELRTIIKDMREVSEGAGRLVPNSRVK